MIDLDEIFSKRAVSELVDSFKRAVALKSSSIFTRRAKNATSLLMEGFHRFMMGTLTGEERDFFGKIKKNHACSITLLDEWKIMLDYNNGIRSDKIRKLYGITEDMLLRLKRVYHVKPYTFDNPIKPKTKPVILTGKITGKRIRIFNKTLWDFIQKNGQYYVHFHGASGGGGAGMIDVRIDKDSTGGKLNTIKTKGAYGAYVWIARFKHKINVPGGKVVMNVCTDDEALKHALMEINGSLRLNVPRVFLRGSIYRRYKNTALVQVCCRELASALKRENVSTVYVDVRDGYSIIKPVDHQPSVNSCISYLQNDGDRVRFSIPMPHSKIRYVGILGIDLNTRNLFITDGEYKIARELLSRGYALRCGSYWQAFDVEVLKLDGKVERSAVIQITDCKPIRNARDCVIADVYSCEMFSKMTNRQSFVVLNQEWRNVLTDFDGFDVYNNARENCVHFFFVDYSHIGWSKKVVDAIAELLPPQNFPTSTESCLVQAFS